LQTFWQLRKQVAQISPNCYQLLLKSFANIWDVNQFLVLSVIIDLYEYIFIPQHFSKEHLVVKKSEFPFQHVAPKKK